MLWGRQDEWLSVDVGRRLHGLLPHAGGREIEAAGHLVQIDAPVALSHELTSRLAMQTG